MAISLSLSLVVVVVIISRYLLIFLFLAVFHFFAHRTNFPAQARGALGPYWLAGLLSEADQQMIDLLPIAPIRKTKKE